MQYLLFLWSSVGPVGLLSSLVYYVCRIGGVGGVWTLCGHVCIVYMICVEQEVEEYIGGVHGRWNHISH